MDESVNRWYGASIGMDTPEFAPLFSAIDAHLCTERAEARCCAARAYWQQQPVVTREQITLLAGLTCTPASEQEIAERLGLDVCAARQVIDAMVAIGLLELLGGGFRSSPTAIMYCRSLPAESDRAEPI
jgi:hypothetical protein